MRSLFRGSRTDSPSPVLGLLDDLARDPLLASTVVRVETKIGSVLVHAEDEVMTPFIQGHREWEPDEAAWIERSLRSGATMLDVGANIGYFSLLAAQKVGVDGHVIAVEPEQRNLRVLRHNVWGHANVEIIAAAAWDTLTTLELRFNETNAGDHQVHAESLGGSAVLVPALPLDSVLEGRRVDVIKVDTQGTDHHVLAGLTRTLGANRHATLLVEFWLDSMEERGERGSDVLAQYRQFGRPIGLLQPGGGTVLATDGEIMAAAERAPGRFVNLVFEAA